MRYPWRIVFVFALMALWLAACTRDTLPPEVVSPSVAIVEPVEHALVGATVPIEIVTSDRRGLAELSFYVNDGEPQPLELKSRNRFSLMGMPSGQNLLTVRAENIDGRVTEVTRRFVVDATPPLLELLYPVQGGILVGQVGFLATAADPLVGGVASGIREVEFFVRGESVGMAQDVGPDPDRQGFRLYELAVDTTAFQDGAAQVTVRVADNAGNARSTGTSAVILNAEPDPGQAPRVFFMNPVSGASVSGDSVTLRARAEARQPGISIQRVEFFVNGVLLGEGTPSGSDYTFTWDSTIVPDGQVTLSALAIDTATNTSEHEITVTVANAVAREIHWSSIALTTPFPGMRLAGTVDLRALVYPLDGVDRVEFFIEDETAARARLGEASLDDGEYVLVWQTWRVEPGDYALIARYTDNAGMQDEVSIPVKVATPFIIQTPSDLEGVGPGTSPPREIVAVTVGLNGTLYGNLPDVTSVEMFINNSSAGFAASIEGTSDVAYVFSWDTTVAVPPSADPPGNAGGHDPDKSGDRIITARITHALGEFLTPGVLVHYRPLLLEEDEDN